MRRSVVQFRVSAPSVLTRSWADFITITFGFKFSVHTGKIRKYEAVRSTMKRRAMNGSAARTGGIHFVSVVFGLSRARLNVSRVLFNIVLTEPVYNLRQSSPMPAQVHSLLFSLLAGNLLRRLV